jgi:DNA-binding Lrp family transcriptional regulator
MSHTIPVDIDDPINARILAVSEDQVQGFVRRPFAMIAERSGVELPTVLERIRAMMEAGVIRRVRQTLMTTSLAHGALVAWKVPPERLNDGFDYLFHNDPFSGHVVVRSTDAQTAGSEYRLWTTLKVPPGYSLEKHCDYLAEQIGAETYRIMPAKRLFKLGVGHVRRRSLEPGAKTDEPGQAMETNITPLDEQQWRVLGALKREFEPDEVAADPWQRRAAEVDMPVERFCQVAERLNELGVVGRFSTFLEHVKKTSGAKPVTRYNALFHWAVPEGRELEAGSEVARHHCMTHAYWREGGPEFNNVNIMGVAHGMEKDRVLAHKQAIDEHLAACGIPVSYTNVFWGGRSEIKPSELMPDAYRDWCRSVGLDPESMR